MKKLRKYFLIKKDSRGTFCDISVTFILYDFRVMDRPVTLATEKHRFFMYCILSDKLYVVLIRKIYSKDLDTMTLH